jgi:hypothetical protein
MTHGAGARCGRSGPAQDMKLASQGAAATDTDRSLPRYGGIDEDLKTKISELSQ